jgi:hypothetical protein
MWHIVDGELTIMSNKMLWLVVQLAICISLVWLTKKISGIFTIYHLAIAFILSFVITKLIAYWVGQRKTRGIEQKPGM